MKFKTSVERKVLNEPISWKSSTLQALDMKANIDDFCYATLTRKLFFYTFLTARSEKLCLKTFKISFRRHFAARYLDITQNELGNYEKKIWRNLKWWDEKKMWPNCDSVNVIMRRRREFYILNCSNTVLTAIVFYSLLIGEWEFIRISEHHSDCTKTIVRPKSEAEWETRI